MEGRPAHAAGRFRVRRPWNEQAQLPPEALAAAGVQPDRADAAVGVLRLPGARDSDRGAQEQPGQRDQHGAQPGQAVRRPGPRWPPDQGGGPEAGAGTLPRAALRQGRLFHHHPLRQRGGDAPDQARIHRQGPVRLQGRAGQQRLRQPHQRRQAAERRLHQLRLAARRRDGTGAQDGLRAALRALGLGVFDWRLHGRHQRRVHDVAVRERRPVVAGGHGAGVAGRRGQPGPAARAGRRPGLCGGGRQPHRRRRSER